MAPSSASLPASATWDPDASAFAGEREESPCAPRFDALLLALTAGVNLSIVRFETSMTPSRLAVRIAAELGIAVGLWIMLRAMPTRRPLGWGGVTTGLIAAACYPFAYECCLRLLGGGAEPLEIAALNVVFLAAMVLAAFSYLPRMAGTSVLLSSSLLLFATTITTSRLAFVLAGAYGVFGLWWLMGTHWERLEGSFIASTVERRLPIRMFVVSTTGLVAIGVAVILGTAAQSTHSLRGFMPTSGGNRWNDPHARSGVGDGDDLVAAQDQALSFGAVESELFLDSKMPSLYDVFDENYGEPRNSKQQQERAVALERQDREEAAERIAQSKRSGREFSIFRRRAERRQQQLADRDAPAMLYVVGQTPLHLSLESYDDFNGTTWEQHAAWKERYEPTLETRDGHPWVQFRRPGAAAVFRGEQHYSLKVINLKTNRIPISPHFAAAHIDRIDRSDFFDWTDDGMVELSGREHIPQLTVIHLRSFGLTLAPLRTRERLPLSPSQGAKTLREAYLNCTNENAADLARTWAKGRSRKWHQVEAVVDRLRSNFVHDPTFVVPDDCDDPVGLFLEARRGPDYLFATTAALMLRSLGCPTRMVSGFYAKAERFDRRAGQTAVLAEDVHVWAEVCVDGHNWVTIEPTPGYAPPSENLTMREWWAQLLTSLLAWCSVYRAPIALAFAAIMASAVWRAALLDLVGTAVCHLMSLRSPEARLFWTVRLLEWRAWLAGRRRPRASTIATWYRPLAATPGSHGCPDLKNFFHFIDHLLYSPRATQLVDPTTGREACRAAANVSRREIRSQLPQL